MTASRLRVRRHFALLVLTFLGCLAPGIASADDIVARANSFYSSIADDKRSDLVLLPLLAKMEAPPAGAETPAAAALIPAGSASWSTVESWAMSPPQRAVVEAIHKITKDEDPRTAMAFAQPYGVESGGVRLIPVELIRAKLYTELGDPPLLAAAKHMYLPALDKAACLINVEATRLAASGDVAGAINVLIDWVFFSRQIADRQMFHEVRWGIAHMADGLQRIRDVAYTDFRAGADSGGAPGAKAKLTRDAIAKMLSRLDEKRGYIGVERLNFPIGNRFAAEQLVERTFIIRAGTNPATFAPTLARLASSDRPLRLFSEAARWQEVAGTHEGWFDTKDKIDKVFGDWTSRWTLSAFDPRMDFPYDYSKLSPSTDAIVMLVCTDADGKEMSVLFRERQVLRTEAVGTRTALGMESFVLGSGGNFPPDITSLQPQPLREVESDPFNPNRAKGARPALQYFVPNKINAKRVGAREVAKPHEIQLVKEGIAVNVGEDQFILYSVGSDGAKNWAERVENTAEDSSNADYLVWPPVLSLVRQNRIDMGTLK
jgi:hypothetical protein